MKSTSPNNKIVSGIVIILIFMGIVFGYYIAHREGEKLHPTPSGNKRSENDSAVRVDPDKTPAEMGIKPKVDPKDGSVKIVEDFITVNASHPTTFKFLEWSGVSTEGKYWKVRCKYRGVSSFNAEVTTNAWFYIQNNKVVYTKIISKI